MPCVSDTHVDTYLLRHPLGREGVYARWACLPSSFHAKSKLYCGPNGAGPTAEILEDGGGCLADWKELKKREDLSALR